MAATKDPDSHGLILHRGFEVGNFDRRLSAEEVKEQLSKNFSKGTIFKN